MRKDAETKNIKVILIWKQCFCQPFYMIQMFYKRKLAKFNFTVCVGKKKGIVNFVMKHEVGGGFMRSPPAWKHS